LNRNDEGRMTKDERGGRGAPRASLLIRHCSFRRPARSAGSPGAGAVPIRNPHFAIRNRWWSRRLRGVAVWGLLAAGGCTDLAGYDLDILLGYIPFFSYMRTTVAIETYEMPRLPAEGSIPAVNPRGDVPPPFTQADLVQGVPEIEGLQNPLQPTAAVLARGQQLYQQHCFACHGAEGAGDGPVVGAGRFPFAPPAHAAAVAQFSDGYLYGVIRVGRGLMPAYGDRSTHLDRWAMVLYMRHLGVVPAAVVPPGAPIVPAEPAPGAPLPPQPEAEP
jgi:mono/diheme cytochrome c family protein